MRTAILILICLALDLFSAKAGGPEHPIQVSANSIVILERCDSAMVAEAVVHVRAAATGNKSAEWGLVWNHLTDDNYFLAKLILPKDYSSDDIYSSSARLEVKHIQGDENEVIYTNEIPTNVDTRGGYNSLKLVFDEPEMQRARLYVGSKEPGEPIQVPFSSLSPGGFGYYIGGNPVKLRRASCMLDTLPQIQTSRFADADALLAVLACSQDSVEGVWEYMDRNISRTTTVPGGRYRLATVANDAGGYDIVYLGGAEKAPLLWKPMKIKGRLWPTIFVDNYDLEWIDSFGRRMEGEQSASLMLEKSLLQFDFPLEGATLRFRRVSDANLVR